MTDIPEIERKGPETWVLALPDWGKLDTVWCRRLPFALWSVGEQALLFHWLDAAVDQGTEKVRLLVADRPMEVRQQVANAQLWPIQIEVQSVPSIDHSKVDDSVDRLPNTARLESPPEDGWALIQHWYEIEQAWLEAFVEETKAFGEYAAIGKNCEIAADAKLTSPYWIGSFVSIGPGSIIGPGAVIEDGSILAGNNRVERAHVGSHTYLGPQTDLVEAALHRNELLNLKHRAHIKSLETFLAGGVGKNHEETEQRPSLRDRWLALRLYLRWAKLGYTSETEFTDLQGTIRPQLQDSAIKARGPWLRQVVSGKLPLFGVTPRPRSSLSQLPEEWQSILQSAPPGAFSYADVMGSHEIGSEDEALHCIYQTSDHSERCRQVFDNWLLELD